MDLDYIQLISAILDDIQGILTFPNYFQPFSLIFINIILFSTIFSHFQWFFVNLPENQQKWLYSGKLTHPFNLMFLLWFTL